MGQHLVTVCSVNVCVIARGKHEISRHLVACPHETVFNLICGQIEGRKMETRERFVLMFVADGERRTIHSVC